MRQEEFDSALERRELVRQIKALSSRDLQLWTIAALLMLVLAVGFVTLVIPNAWPTAEMRVNKHYLPQLTLGLLALVLLFNFYVVQQKREMSHTRQELIRRITLSNELNQQAFVDKLTQVFSRKFLEQCLPAEVRRANVEGSPLTFVMIWIRDFQRLRITYGDDMAQEGVVHASQILRGNFRGSDTLVRYAESSFLVLMPDTPEHLAKPALDRLRNKVEHWNLASHGPYDLQLTWVVTPFHCGDDAWKRIEEMANASVPISMTGGPRNTPALTTNN
jgi:diguanylate cyclase (GGDEF)-like protein